MLLTRRTIFATALGIASAAAVTASEPAHGEELELENQFLSLGTSSVGGTWYPLGGAIASVISNVYPALNITAEVTGGTIDNLKLLKNDQLELALSTNAEAYNAYKGEGSFDEKIQNFGGIIGGHGIFWQLYTLKSTGITSIRDLEGKRVSLGAAGSIGNEIGETVIEAHGLEMNEDWQPEYISHGDGPGALRDGRIDAALIVSSFPTAPVTDITSTDGADVVFLNPEPEVLDRLIAERPYWSKAPIPGGLYKGHEEDIANSFGVVTILVAKSDLDDDVVYAVTKALLEHPDELGSAHALGRDWIKENATRGIEGVIPFHPGAEKYLKEQGLL